MFNETLLVLSHIVSFFNSMFKLFSIFSKFFQRINVIAFNFYCLVLLLTQKHLFQFIRIVLIKVICSRLVW